MIDLELLSAYDDLLHDRLVLLKRNSAYAVGDIVQKDGKYLVCKVAGTTDTTSLDVSSSEVGDLLTDGSVTWKRISAPFIVNHEIDGYDILGGMNVKITQKGVLVGNDLIKDVRAAGNSDELAYLGNKEIGNKEVFDNWIPFTCDSSGSNWNDDSSSDQAQARNSYSFDTSNEAIICNRNNEAFSAFVSQDTYAPNFTIEYTIDNRILASIDPSLPGDDDGLFFILGFMIDDDGNYHTLSVIRNGDADNTHGMRFAIAYDLFTSWTSGIGSTGLILENNTSLSAHSWDATSYANIQVEKTSTTITAKTSEINSSSYAVTLTYTLPATKPATMTQEQYDNIKYMLENDTRVGFGTQSNPSAFKILSTSDALNGVSVYNVNTVEKAYYEGGTKISETPDNSVLVPQELVYSNLNKRLYFIKDKNKIREIEFNTFCIDWKPETLYVKDSIAYYDGSVYRCKTINSDATFDISKWENVGTLSKVPDWTTEKVYEKDTMVLYNGTLYRSNITHTSSSVDFMSDVDKWDIAYTNLANWSASTAYKQGSVIVKDNNVYTCLTTNNDASWDGDKWSLINSVPTWATNIYYPNHILVVYGGDLYRCVIPHVSTSTFETEKWEVLGGGGGGGAASGYKQITKYSATASSEIEIGVNTTDFCMPPVEVLKFESGSTGVVVNKFTFSSGDGTAFEVDGVDGKDSPYVVFDGFVYLNTDVVSDMTTPVALGDGYLSISDDVDLDTFSYVEEVVVR